MMFWKKEILEAIGGKIGKFIAMEENWEQKIDKICTKILIEVNLRHRLFKEIDSWKIMEEKFGLLEDSIPMFFLQTGWPYCKRLPEPQKKSGVVQKIVG